MKSNKPKKMLIMNVLDILKKYTDSDHRLSQKDIADILKNEYDMPVDRKTVKRNILDLIDLGYDINYTEGVRKVRDKDGSTEDSATYSDFYLERDFSDSELRLLIDSLLFSKHIPHSQCKELATKLEGLSGKYFKSRMRHINVLPDQSLDNKQLLYTIEILDEAIADKRQARFNYVSFGTDKKNHPRKNENGEIKEYRVNPYQIATNNGRYYLICNLDGTDGIRHYRLDRISNIKLMESKALPPECLDEFKNGFDVFKHMKEHPYMYSGKSSTVIFKAKKYLLNDLFDWFGKDIDFTDETEEDITARVFVSENAMRRWAMQYALHTRILSPQSLADQVKEDLKTALKNYGE